MIVIPMCYFPRKIGYFSIYQMERKLGIFSYTKCNKNWVFFHIPNATLMKDPSPPLLGDLLLVFYLSHCFSPSSTIVITLFIYILCCTLIYLLFVLLFPSYLVLTINKILSSELMLNSFVN